MISKFYVLSRVSPENMALFCVLWKYVVMFQWNILLGRLESMKNDAVSSVVSVRVMCGLHATHAHTTRHCDGWSAFHAAFWQCCTSYYTKLFYVRLQKYYYC